MYCLYMDLKIEPTGVQVDLPRQQCLRVYIMRGPSTHAHTYTPTHIHIYIFHSSPNATYQRWLSLISIGPSYRGHGRPA